MGTAVNNNLSRTLPWEAGLEEQNISPRRRKSLPPRAFFALCVCLGSLYRDLRSGRKRTVKEILAASVRDGNV